MNDNPEFCKSVMEACTEPAYSLSELIVEAMKVNKITTAKYLFKIGLELSDGQWKKINSLTDDVIIS